MLFYQRRFQDESFDFVIGDDDLDVGDLFDQLNGFDVVADVSGAASRLEIRTDAIAQVLGFADIDDFARGVLVEIDTGRSGNFFEFFVERHSFQNWPQRHGDTEKCPEGKLRSGWVLVISLLLPFTPCRRVSVSLWQTPFEYDN